MLEFFSTQSGHSHFSHLQGSAEQPPLQCALCPHFKQVYLIYLSCKNGTAILFPLPVSNYACYNKAVGYYIYVAIIIVLITATLSASLLSTDAFSPSALHHNLHIYPSHAKQVSPSMIAFMSSSLITSRSILLDTLSALPIFSERQ